MNLRQQPTDSYQPGQSTSVIQVAVAAPTLLEQAALEALLATLPGLKVVKDASAAHVQLWLPAETVELPPVAESATAVLAVVSDLQAISPANVAGLFDPNEPPVALGAAIRQVARGQEYLSRSLALALLKQERDADTAGPATLADLTEREREVLTLLGQGYSNKDIAAHLYLSVRTVEGHLSNAYGKLNVNSRTEAALLASRLL